MRALLKVPSFSFITNIRDGFLPFPELPHQPAMSIHNKVIHKHLQEVNEFLAGDHTRLREVLHPANDGVELPYSLAHAFLEPGTSSLPHRLEKSDEAYFFLNGEGILTIDDQQHHVKAGDLVLVPAGALQHLENTGQDQLTFLCIVSPPWSEAEEKVEQHRR
jgi:mannose-6-phosphate isomerase-like protein (cupin superfamily)